jgi:hypothetical protein
MRTNKLAALSLIALAVSASGAFAQTAAIYPHGEVDMVASTPFVSTRSRADVIAELQQSKSAVVQGEAGGSTVAVANSSLTRADVRAATLSAFARGEITQGEALLAVTGRPAARLPAVHIAAQTRLPDGVTSIRSGEAYGYADAPFVSTRTRSEVKAELQQALAQGTVQTGEADHAVAATSTRSRADVRAEARQAVSQGTVATGEVAGQLGRQL